MDVLRLLMKFRGIRLKKKVQRGIACAVSPPGCVHLLSCANKDLLCDAFQKAPLCRVFCINL